MDSPTQTLVGSKAREAIHAGVNAIYNPVKKTFGPEGKNALLYGTYGREPRITNDGYTVAGTQEPKNPFVRLAATTFKEACRKTNEVVGDATTATTIIGGRLYNDAYKLLLDNQIETLSKSENISVNTLKKQILETAKKVQEEIKNNSKKISSLKDLEKIAIISVEDAELGKLIAKMAWDVGVDGVIDTTEGHKSKIETEVIEGMRFPAKVASKAFVNNIKKHEMVAIEAPVFITNFTMDNSNKLIEVLAPITEKYNKAVIVAPSFTPQVLNMLFKSMVQTDAKGTMVRTGIDLFPVAVPSLKTEQFEDLAIYCNSKFINKDKGDKLESLKLEDCGLLDKLIVYDTDVREDAAATGGAGTKLNYKNIDNKDAGFEGKETKEEKKTPIQKRIEVLKSQLEEEKSGQTYKNILKNRIASMSSAVGIIRVADSTRASGYYKKLKIEDAVYACKSALKNGYVKGGGLCLKEIADDLPDDNILKNALIEPYDIIQKTTGGITITDDIIDPSEAMHYAVEHACGVVATLITSDVITIEIDAPLPEEGNYAIANVMKELVVSDKIHKGQLKENEQEVFKDSMGGLTQPEFEDTFKE